MKHPLLYNNIFFVLDPHLLGVLFDLTKVDTRTEVEQENDVASSKGKSAD